MAAVLPSLPQYPTACPACGKSEGYPQVVTTDLQNRYKLIIRLRCLACDHRWEDSVETFD